MTRFHGIAPRDLEAALAAPTRPFVLDVRDRAQYEAGHVPGSALLPVHEMAARRGELPVVKVKPIVVVGEPGTRTTAAATWLVLVGYGDVRVLDGGWPAWTGPVETGPAPPPRPRGPELRIV